MKTATKCADAETIPLLTCSSTLGQQVTTQSSRNLAPEGREPMNTANIDIRVLTEGVTRLNLEPQGSVAHVVNVARLRFLRPDTAITSERQMQCITTLGGLATYRPHGINIMSTNVSNTHNDYEDVSGMTALDPGYDGDVEMTSDSDEARVQTSGFRLRCLDTRRTLDRQKRSASRRGKKSTRKLCNAPKARKKGIPASHGQQRVSRHRLDEYTIFSPSRVNGRTRLAKSDGASKGNRKGLVRLKISGGNSGEDGLNGKDIRDSINMKFATGLAGIGAVAATLLGSVAAASYDDIPDIEVYGQHFFYTNNGSQFYLRGVAYQQNYSPNGSASSDATYTDPLADGDACRRDIPYLKQIYTNILRVYAIDPTKNHDDCMAQLASADIYVIADLGEPSTSIRSNDPEWDVTLYQRYTGVVDVLSKYKNVIGFFAGNENVSAGNQTAAAAFVKAAVRDVKGYISAQGYRKTLGVGYATADVPTRDELAHYFACEPGNSGNSTQIDYWGYNVYSWCGDSNYATSSYGERVDFFSDYPVPVFFAESTGPLWQHDERLLRRYCL
ncbi:hypothetical protein OPT61_g6152 [Boeremia exigua]|uniref:Uncharacterized protein n=1 Tax=Boeremia exigua TaxID=749465 RepID=A0ACC2I7P4_9PLEO|nr:hypothetical protein OPT61_g6152 [Boeremia exigua]